MAKIKAALILAISIILILNLSAFAAAKPAAKKMQSKPKAASIKPKPVPAKPVEWAAKVNGDIISMDLYNKRLDSAKKEIIKEISLEAAEEKGILTAVKKAILEQMIEAVVLLQWAEREGIEIKDKAIKAKIQELKKTFPTAQEFHKSLSEQGMTVADLERDIKKQLIIEKLIDLRAKALAVTDEEMRSFYDKNIDLYVQKDKLHLKQMFFKVYDSAQATKQKLSSGSVFGGEDIGLVEPGQLPVEDDSRLFSLKTGGISDIISGEAGYYIFKVEERIPGKETKFGQVEDNIRKFLLREKGRTQYLQDLEEEKANAKIILNEKLGKLY